MKKFILPPVVTLGTLLFLYSNRKKLKVMFHKSRLLLLSETTESCNCNQVDTSTDSNEINIAIFFPESIHPCRFYYKDGYCRRTNCEYSHNAKLLTSLINYLEYAKSSLDICVYMITSHELLSALFRIHKRGVEIKVITDGTFGDEDRTRIKELRAEGIAVRCNLPETKLLMHHKFAIVDNNILINGSFNWTWQAIIGNHENLFITSNKVNVVPYVNEFQRLWKEFEPARQKFRVLKDFK
ncbi:hypothetical protein CHUAL_011902 [Chamberlinius hualienensis]